MEYSTTIKRWLPLLSLLVFIYPASANAALIELNFRQGGWEGGGAIELQVFAEDRNRDGRVSSADGEVESGVVRLVGHASISERPIPLERLVYDLDGGPIGDSVDEGVLASLDDFSYLTGFGTLSGACGSEPRCAEYSLPFSSIFSSAPLLLVDEPTLAWLSVAACVVLMRRRKVRLS